MYKGRLYKSNPEQLIANVYYRLIDRGPSKPWGELVPVESGPISDGGDYIVELEDNNKIRCNLRKNINQGVTGMPPRFVYRFVGS